MNASEAQTRRWGASKTRRRVRLLATLNRDPRTAASLRLLGELVDVSASTVLEDLRAMQPAGLVAYGPCSCCGRDGWRITAEGQRATASSDGINYGVD